MRIEHLAIWCQDLEKMRDFYERYFAAKANHKYTNARGFSSYFLSFESGCRLELMQWAAVQISKNQADQEYLGLAHLCVQLGSQAAVDALTQQLQQDGYPLLSGPRLTGDGYYESCLLDPELNRLELCA